MPDPQRRVMMRILAPEYSIQHVHRVGQPFHFIGWLT